MAITLLTDFGNQDGYVGMMKGVILSRSTAEIVDLSHEIGPQNIEQAAFVLHHSWQYFPPGSVHVVVVDPGVGSDRAILAVAAGGHFFLAPDNGVLKYVFDACLDAAVHRVENSKLWLFDVSHTFHGRDIFAPVAAYLAEGNPIEPVGPVTDDYHKGHVSEPVTGEYSTVGEILCFDHFGNGITNIIGSSLPDRELSIAVGVKNLGSLKKNYAAVPVGESVPLIGSHGYLEISIRNGNAKKELPLHIGEEITINWIGEV